MFAVPIQSPKLTPVEYFAWEEQQLCRHELIIPIHPKLATGSHAYRNEVRPVPKFCQSTNVRYSQFFFRIISTVIRIDGGWDCLDRLKI